MPKMLVGNHQMISEIRVTIIVLITSFLLRKARSLFKVILLFCMFFLFFGYFF